MINILDTVIIFIQSHLVWIAGIVAIIFFVMWLMGKGKKKELKPVFRKEYDKKIFEERNELNPSPVKWLYKGNTLLGKIKFLKGTKIINQITKKTRVKTDDGEMDVDVIDKTIDKSVYEIVIAPLLWELGFKIVNPFGNRKCIIVFKNSTAINYAESQLWIDPKKPFEQIYGIYYEANEELDLVDFVQDKSIFRVDMEKASDQYFAESLKRSAINQDYAHAEAMAREELEIEMAKRRGKQSSI